MADKETNVKTVVVTGAGRGIGAAIVETLAESGKYRFVLAARTASELDALAEVCRERGVEAIAIPTDVTSEAQVQNLFRKTLETFGVVDVLINNAGAGVFKSILETTLEEWRSVFDVNATSAFLCSRDAFQIMSQRQSGVIINIASVVGIAGYPDQAAYTASKHAMVGLTKVLAAEGKEYGIKAHVICPGGVDTEMAAQARPDLDRDILIKPEIVAETVQFLLELPPGVSIDTIHLRRFGSQSFLL